MDLKSSDKIVSLHFQDCKKHCQNKSVCYLLKRDHNGPSLNTFTIRTAILELGYQVYESICDKLTPYHFGMLNKYKNYNITISCNNFDKELYNYKNQVQLSVYSEKDIKKYQGLKLLYLIFDKKTENILHKNIKNVNIIIDIDYIKNNRNLLRKIVSCNHRYYSNDKVEILYGYNNCYNMDDPKDKNISFDSCLSSWIINGKCPYKNNNYIDIGLDGVRTCPFQKKAQKLDLNNLFNIENKNNCIYNKFFKG